MVFKPLGVRNIKLPLCFRQFAHYALRLALSPGALAQSSALARPYLAILTNENLSYI